MNKELFDSMRKQMTPSPQVRAELSEKLAQPVKKRPVPWKKYGALAACAALVVGVLGASQYPSWEHILQNFRPSILERKLHSYVTVENMTGYIPENATTATGGSEGAVRDTDMGMTPQDLEQAMLDVGYTQEEIDEYQAIGYQMTWANWWKFVGEQQNSEGDDPFNLDSLKVFSQKELYVSTGALPAPNTGDLPGGAYVGDVSTQEEAMQAYDKLAPFTRSHPDWYGGAYIDSSGWLVVQLVEDKDPADKSLELQVLDWTDNGHVMFSSCKYSLAYLHDLQDKVVDAMQELDLFSSCGADEESNRLDLTLTSVTDRALILLAQLDPDDDAIFVQAGQRAVADVGFEDLHTDSSRTEDPAVRHVMPGGVTVPDDEDLTAVEPYYVEELPGKLPKEEQRSATHADTSCYDPDAK